ncbi:serine/threonine protein kinase, partial [Streptomyces sp. NPDC006356]
SGRHDGEVQDPAASSPPASAPPRLDGGRKRRFVPAVVGVAAVATVITGTVYVTSHRGAESPGADARRSASTIAPSDVPAPPPEGFHLVSDKKLGVSFPVPDGWKARKGTPDEVTYSDPSGLVGITIGMVDPAGSHPKAHFLDIEANTKINYPTSYRRLRMQETTFRGQPAAVWEFTFKGRARVFRAIDIGFGREGEREYDIYLSAPDAAWHEHRPVFDAVRDGFVTTRS